MLEYDRVYVYEEIDVNTINSLPGCVIYHFWYFLQTNFQFQSRYAIIAMI